MKLLDMVEKNELNRSLLALLDENIANAHSANQVIAVWKGSFYVYLVLLNSLIEDRLLRHF